MRCCTPPHILGPAMLACLIVTAPIFGVGLLFCVGHAIAQRKLARILD